MKQNRKVWITLIVVLILATAGLVAATPSASDLLTDALTNLENATDVQAIVEMEVETPEMSSSGSVAVWGQLDAGPNGEPAFRVEVLSSTFAEAPIGLTAVGDGTTFWVWHPEENIVLTDSYEALAQAAMEKMSEHEGEMPFNADDLPAHDDADHPETAEEAVAQLLEYVTAERDGMADIGSDRAHQIRLVPIPEQMPEEVRAIGGFVNVWVRADDRAPLGAEFVESAVGSARVTAVDLRLNEGIDPGVFTFSIPEDATVLTVADLQAMAEAKAAFDAAAMEDVDPDFAVLAPESVPGDAVLLEQVNVQGAVVQRYAMSDGRDFSITQSDKDVVAYGLLPDGYGEAVTVRGADGRFFQDDNGMRSLLTWQENGITFVIGGDLTTEEALAVAESLK
ncbi:MAG: hypothetical protein Kow0080_35200 [Candidatus Promineifilaceae bacterium]